MARNKKKDIDRDTIEKPIEEPIVEEVVTEEPVVEDVIANGYVSGCERLNIRESADKDSNVLGIIKKDDKVVINISKSTLQFYNVCTSAGVEGYCIVDFITVE